MTMPLHSQFQEALARRTAVCGNRVGFTLDVVGLIGLIQGIQIALRSPMLPRHKRDELERIARAMIDALAGPEQVIGTVLGAGFDDAAFKAADGGVGAARSTGVRVQAAHKHHAEFPDPAQGEHLWVIGGLWRTTPRPDGAYLLDTENLLSLEGPCCYVCEQAYSPEAASTPCPGDPGAMENQHKRGTQR